jgi:hypothetical protein
VKYIGHNGGEVQFSGASSFLGITEITEIPLCVDVIGRSWEEERDDSRKAKPL